MKVQLLSLYFVCTFVIIFVKYCTYIYPLIGTDQPENITIHPTSDNKSGLRGDLQISHLFQNQTDAIIYVRVT